MKRLTSIFNRLSLRRKLFAVMALISVVPVVIVTAAALSITYVTMRDQLIYDRRMSVEWLQSRLELEIEAYTRTFYEFEINKDFREDLYAWSAEGLSLGYAEKWQLISALNQTVSINSNINSIELYNLENSQALLAERSGAVFVETGDRLDDWQQSDGELQTNVVFIRDGKEILLIHRLHRFEDGRPLALMVMRLRPYFLQDILDDIKTMPSETILLFSDRGELIVSDESPDMDYTYEQALDVAEELSGTLSGDMKRDGYFWFYRTAGGGKIIILQSIPDSAIRKALGATLLSGLSVAALAVALSIVFSAAFSRITSKPIVQLAQQMQTASFDSSCPAPESPRGDEIGLLQHSFGEMLQKNRELIDSEYKSKIAKRNAQLYALQSQINPHFMYNTLQVIGGMAIEKDAPEIYMVTSAMGSILRYSLGFSHEMVKLREEIHYLESYVTIQNRRFGEKINLTIDIPPRLLDALVPRLILQPLLENSFEHGFPEKESGWDITLRASRTQEGLLKIRLSDNGVGISQTQLAEIRKKLLADTDAQPGPTRHIGLANVNMRLRLRYGEPCGVTVSSRVGRGTSVTVVLKYELGDGAAGPASDAGRLDKKD